jgi:hypothetical protein
MYLRVSTHHPNSNSCAAVIDGMSGRVLSEHRSLANAARSMALIGQLGDMARGLNLPATQIAELAEQECQRLYAHGLDGYRSEQLSLTKVEAIIRAAAVELRSRRQR